MTDSISTARTGKGDMIWGILMLICGFLAITLPLASGIGVAIVIGWLLLIGAALDSDDSGLQPVGQRAPGFLCAAGFSLCLGSTYSRSDEDDAHDRWRHRNKHPAQTQ